MIGLLDPATIVRLELERAVLHVEVRIQTLAEPVEHLGGSRAAKAALVGAAMYWGMYVQADLTTM